VCDSSGGSIVFPGQAESVDQPRGGMSMRNKISMGVLFTLIPVALAAQSPEQRIESAIATAQAVGVPISLLESKVQEGRAKGVPMNRIAAAVEFRAASLNRARAVLAGTVSDADLVATADALDLGVNEAVLRTLAEAAPSGRRAVAITALAELVSRDIAPDRALDRVMEALTGSPSDLASLPGQSMPRPDKRSGSAGSSPASSGVTPGAGAARLPPSVPSSGGDRPVTGSGGRPPPN
jgi:hypothetical protein